MATQIRLRRDTYQNWYSNNPVLALAEPGYDTTNKKLKIGDGTTAWRALDYFNDSLTTDRIVNGINSLILETDGSLTAPYGKLGVTPQEEFGISADADTASVIQSNDGAHKWTFNIYGGLEIPGGIQNPVNYNSLDFTSNAVYLSSGESSVNIVANNDNNGQQWTFGLDGKLTLPVGGDIVDSNGTSVLGGGGSAFTGDLGSNTLTQSFSYTKTIAHNIALGTSVVIWSGSYNYISSAKLVIQVECTETGDTTGWHSQVCEAIIASRGYANSAGGPLGEPHMTVYGVTHTSVNPLVTFTVQRDPITKLIEVVGTTTSAANGQANLRIHSVEMATTD